MHHIVFYPTSPSPNKFFKTHDITPIGKLYFVIQRWRNSIRLIETVYPNAYIISESDMVHLRLMDYADRKPKATFEVPDNKINWFIRNFSKPDCLTDKDEIRMYIKERIKFFSEME